MLLVRGIAAILLGIAAFLAPGMTLEVLIIVLAAYFLVDGVFAIITAIQRRTTNPRWWVMLIEGIISVIAGIGAFAYPGLTALILLNLVAFWAILTGVMQIVAAIRLREEIKGEFWLGLAGLVSVIFGILLILFPGTGILSLLWLLGSFSILSGIFLIMLAFRVRNLGSSGGNQPTRSPA
jgi:uncharacterized membrane protein HdeD (DUF308 family)